MVILLMYLAWTMSGASVNNEYMVERPSVDIVRQLNVQRMSNNKPHNAANRNGDGTENDSGAEVKLVNINNDMSIKKINALRKYIAGETVGLCDFTCHKCYRCSLVYGESENGISKRSIPGRTGNRPF